MSCSILSTFISGNYSVIVLEVADGRLADLRDSLQNEELRRSYENGEEGFDVPYPHYIEEEENGSEGEVSSYSSQSPSKNEGSGSVSNTEPETGGDPEDPSQYLE